METPAQLAVLGIDCDNGKPSVANFPRSFNQAARFVWEKVLSKNLQGDCPTQWTVAVRQYLNDCRALGVFPYHTSMQQHRNDQLAMFLIDQRRKLSKFFNDSGFFEKFQVQRVERSYQVTPRVFVLSATAYLLPNDDPTWRQWLTLVPLPRFLRDSSRGNTYEKELTPSTQVSVHMRNETTASVTYTITSHTLPEWPARDKVPTPEQMREFVEQTFWMPAVRSHRIKNTRNKFF
jgi:hypothetical protein